MKTIFFLVVVALFISISNAKVSSPAKRSLTCSNFPPQLSGRLFLYVILDSGSTQTMDLHFNLDLNMQRVQMEGDIEGVGSANAILDIKEGKVYATAEGECDAIDVGEIPLGFEDLVKMSFEFTGTLGLKGPSVDAYSFHDDGRKVFGLATFESGGQCIPVSASVTDVQEGAAVTGSFLDLKTTADTEKLKIPEHCEETANRRSISAIIHSVNLKQTVKRGFPWISLN